MKILLSGATGFIGKALLRRLLELGHQPVVLTRRPESLPGELKASVVIEKWDGQSAGPWCLRMEEADAVINLAGEPIAEKCWTAVQKKRILASRVDAARAIVDAIDKAKKKPLVFVNASAIGYYGNVESGDVTEFHSKGKGFLADVCGEWEKSAREAEKSGVRVVILRFGIVLEKDGGALKKMLLPFRLFAGGALGSGRQWVSWVHRDDVVGALVFTLDHKSISGPVNVVSPNPVTMSEFAKAVGESMKRPAWAPVPAFVLRLALGEMSEMLLTGQRVIPRKLKEAQYPFYYPDLDQALRAIFKA